MNRTDTATLHNVQDGIAFMAVVEGITSASASVGRVLRRGFAAAENALGLAKGAKGNPTTRRFTYELNPKHGTQTRGTSSAAPKNGQKVLNKSIQIKDTSTRRIGIDHDTKEFVIFDEHHPDVFHGHVRSWDQLTSEMQSSLRRTGKVDKRGRIK